MTAQATIRESAAQAQRIAVLSVSPAEEDHFHLQNIFTNPHRDLYPDLTFAMTAKSTMAAAKNALKQGPVSIVLCEHDLSPGSWRELLDFAGGLPVPPLVIVTSRVADERMWAEVLNLGGYDVLAKPLNSEEVIRTVTSAWSLWQHRRQVQAGSVRKAGGSAA
jgi:DNA-binding response OmpR family regulator